MKLVSHGPCLHSRPGSQSSATCSLSVTHMLLPLSLYSQAGMRLHSCSPTWPPQALSVHTRRCQQVLHLYQQKGDNSLSALINTQDHSFQPVSNTAEQQQMIYLHNPNRVISVFSPSPFANSAMQRSFQASLANRSRLVTLGTVSDRKRYSTHASMQGQKAWASHSRDTCYLYPLTQASLSSCLPSFTYWLV